MSLGTLETLASQVPLLLVFLTMAALMWRQQRSNDRAVEILDGALARQQMGPRPPPKVGPPLAIPSKPGTVVDQGLLSWMKKEEGFSAKAYPDYHQYSIGYGTKANSPTEVIDETEAEKRLTIELSAAEQSVESFAPNAPVGVKQALTSLTYNAGPSWQSQGLGELVKAGNYQDAKAHFVQYNHAGGKVDDALTARRQAEVAWFDHPL